MLREGLEGVLRRRIDALKAEFEREQDRRVISRDMVFREYLGNKVLIDETYTGELLSGQGPLASNIFLLLDGINSALSRISPMELTGVTAVLARNPREHASFIALRYAPR